MNIVALAWMFVVVLMAAAEATSPQGSLLGAFFTLLLYGVAPLAVVLYLLATPMRRRTQRRAELGSEPATPQPASIPEVNAASAADGDGRSHPAATPVAPERKKP